MTTTEQRTPAEHLALAQRGLDDALAALDAAGVDTRELRNRIQAWGGWSALAWAEREGVA